MLPLYSLVRLKTSCPYNGFVATIIGYDFLGRYKLIIHYYGDVMVTIDLEEFNLIYLGSHCEEQVIQPYIKFLIQQNLIKHVKHHSFIGYSIIFKENDNGIFYTQTMVDNYILELYKNIQSNVRNPYNLQILQTMFYEHLTNCLNAIKKLNDGHGMTEHDQQLIGRATGLNLYDFYQLVNNDNQKSNQ